MDIYGHCAYTPSIKFKIPSCFAFNAVAIERLPPPDSPETIILEIPNPGHPYGVRGVGETSIVPPLAAINNAVSRATSIRFSELPLSPPRVLKAILSNKK